MLRLDSLSALLAWPRLVSLKDALVWIGSSPDVAKSTPRVAPVSFGHDFKVPQPACGRPCRHVLKVITWIRWSYCIANTFHSHLPKHVSTEIPPRDLLGIRSSARLVVALTSTWCFLRLRPSWLTMRNRWWSWRALHWESPDMGSINKSCYIQLVYICATSSTDRRRLSAWALQQIFTVTKRHRRKSSW